MARPYTYSGKGLTESAGLLREYGAQHARQLLADMLRIRRIEEAIEQRYSQDQMKTPIHLSIGQEAICTGLAAALNPDDAVFCSYRSHGHYLAKGGQLQAMLAELHCRSTGCVASRGGSMHLLDQRVGLLGTSAIVGGILPLAAGHALASQMRGRPQVTMAALGDAAMEEGVVWESLNFAALRQLPLLVVCENNYYSVCSPLHARQPENTQIWRKAAAFGLPAAQVDGSNVLAVYAAAREALAGIRRGEGPAFLEFTTYRWRGHHGGGDDSQSGYRSPAEVADWQQHCPVERFAEWLTAAGWFDEAQRAGLEADIATEIETAFAFALASPEPDPGEVLKYVYA